MRFRVLGSVEVWAGKSGWRSAARVRSRYWRSFWVAALRGDAHDAGRLWAVAEAAETRLGMRMLSERHLYERILTPLQDDQAFQAGYQAGRDIELEEAVRELRELNESH